MKGEAKSELFEPSDSWNPREKEGIAGLCYGCTSKKSLHREQAMVSISSASLPTR